MACDLEKAIKKIEVLLKTPDYKGNEKLVEAKGLAEQLMKSKRIENKSTESKQVQKENDTSFQHTSKLIKAEENKALFNSIQKRLKEMYPKIRATELDQILDEQGQEVLGRAVNGVVEYSKKAAIDTLPHEYAHVYINLLEKTTYVDNVLRKISKEQGLNRYEAKEYLVTHMGEKFVAYAKQGKIDDKPVLKLADKVWQFIRKVFGSKDIATTAERMTIIAERFYEGVNADAISAQPKEGFEKVDTEATFKDQPFAAEVLKTVMNKAKGTAVQFTGSAALALQGDIYRKGKDGITDLHDLDFAVVDENTLDSLRSVMFNDFSAYQIYDFGLANGDTKRIATMIVTDKKHKVLHSSVKRSNKLRVVEYSIVDTQTKEEVGTYKADINGRNEITEEHTTGVKAVIVDLMLDSSKGGGIKYHSKELGQEIILSDAASTFDAKNSMGDVPRDKDIRDFTSFYKEEQIDVTGELKQEYKGKVIAANSGTGKSVVANNTEGIIDSDVLLRKVLKIENSASISEALKGKNKREVYLELAKLIKNEVAKGNTVVTPSTEPEIAKLIDIAVIQEDAYVVQKNSNSNKRSDGLSRSLSSAKSSIELFKNNTKKIETVKLTPHEFLADVLLKSNEKPGKLNQQNGTKDEFYKELDKKLRNVLQKLYPEIKLEYTEQQILHGEGVLNQEVVDNTVKLSLKVVEALVDWSTAKPSKYGGKSAPVLETIRVKQETGVRKRLAGKGVPKEQIDFVFEYMKQNDISEMKTSELAEKVLMGLATGVEVSTATKDVSNENAKRNSRTVERLINRLEKKKSQLKESTDKRVVDIYYNEIGHSRLVAEVKKIEGNISRLSNELVPGKVNTKDYVNLTVPGGANYQEKEIATPNIVAPKKGHAEFATDKGIGWYRVDDMVTGSEFTEVPNKFNTGSEVWEKTNGVWGVIIDGEARIERPDLGTAEMRRIYEGQLGTVGGQSTSTLRVLEMQSDMFQQMKGERLDLVYPTQDDFDFEDLPGTKDLNKSFLQLLNTDNKWVKFFIQSIVQDSQTKKYKNIRFPTGETVAKIEGYTKEHGSEAIKKFYQVRVKNTLEKTYGKESIRTITDEHGNQWFELALDSKRDSNVIMLQQQDNEIKGQADIEAKTVLINSLLQSQDTLPHEYAHHYIRMFIDTPIVQEAVKKWGVPKKLYHGFSGNVSKYINKDGDLVLKPAKNFEGKTESVSLTHSFDTASRYAAQIKGGGPEGYNFADASIFELDTDVLHSIPTRDSDEEWAINTNKDVVIPKGSFKVLQTDLTKELLETLGDDTLSFDEHRSYELNEVGDNPYNDVPTESDLMVSYIEEYIEEVDPKLAEKMYAEMERLTEGGYTDLEYNEQLVGEEALVQAIGEQVVEQKGEAYGWWKKFTAMLQNWFDTNFSKVDKKDLKNMLTDAFLERKNLGNKQGSDIITEQDKAMDEILDQIPCD